MAGYTKLFSTILDSTVWLEPLSTRVVWVAMLAMADQDGVVWARAPGIAKRAGVSRKECDTALKTFSSPDPDSRTPDNDGRRAEETDEGWRILNYERYRDMASAAEKAEKNAARQARFRERTKMRNARVTQGNALLHDLTQVTHSEASASASATAEATPAAAGSEQGRSRMMDPSPQPARESSVRADVIWLNNLCAEVTCWTGSLLDGDRLERTAGELVKRASACAAERGIGTRELLDLAMRRWFTPKRMRTRKPWVVMALQDWHETLADLDDDQVRREHNEGMAANAQ